MRTAGLLSGVVQPFRFFADRADRLFLLLVFDGMDYKPATNCRWLMARIFLRNYGDGAEVNARKTLRKSVPVDTIIPEIQNAELRQRLERFRGETGFRLWGFGSNDSHLKLEPGDILLLILKKKREVFYAEVVEPLEDSDGEIGRAVGWKRYPANQTWRPVLLHNVSNISGLIEVLTAAKCEVVPHTRIFQLSGLPH